MDAEEFCISPKISVLESIQTLDRIGKKVLFVCEGKRLIGVVSDSDIRRYILKNGDLSNPVEEMMFSSPRYVRAGEYKRAQAMMLEKGLLAVPALDQQGQIAEVYLWNELTGEKTPPREKINVPVVIMAGGRGTRLAPYTDVLPKPLLPISGKTMLERIVERFERSGCDRFFVTVNYKKGLIRAYLEEVNLADRITLLEEPDFLGTAGCLSLLNRHLSETFFVSNCDILIDVSLDSLLKQHKEQKNHLTMVTSLKSWQVPYGVSVTDDGGRLLGIKEKPSMNFLVNTGVYLLEPELLSMIPQGQVYHMTDLAQACIDKGLRVGTYPIRDGQWQDMGDPESMKKMLTTLRQEECT